MGSASAAQSFGALLRSAQYTRHGNLPQVPNAPWVPKLPEHTITSAEGAAMDEEQIAQLTHAVAGVLGPDNHLRALLLFGSHANGTATPASDYDLIAVTRLEHRSITFAESNRVLDVVCGTAQTFRQRIFRRSPDNNNFALNVFAQARILFDPEGVGVALATEAAALYQAGPTALNKTEAGTSAHGLRKMLGVAQTRVRRNDGSTEDALLATMRLDEVVSHAIYAYFRAERQWTQAFFKTIKEQLPHVPELHSLWREHVTSRENLGQHAATAERIVEYVCEHLDRYIGPEGAQRPARRRYGA